MTGIELELAIVLNVTGQLFHEQHALELAGRIKPDLSIRLAKRLITTNTLLRVNSREKIGSRLRRDAFRWIQRLARQSHIQPERRMEKPLSAVFVAEVSSVTAPMLASWVNKGHRIAAIVVPGPRAGKHRSFSTLRRRWRRRFALRSHLGRAMPRLVELGPSNDWDAIRQQLGTSGADLLVCFGYGKLIPQTLLELFPEGGLNLHPALLPHYRGPHPIHRLVMNQDRAGVHDQSSAPAQDQYQLDEERHHRAMMPPRTGIRQARSNRPWPMRWPRW